MKPAKENPLKTLNGDNDEGQKGF